LRILTLKIAIILFCLPVWGGLYGQTTADNAVTLSGQILEKGSKDPVLGGSLYLEAAGNTIEAATAGGPTTENTTPLSADADLKGNYKISVMPGQYKLVVAGEGFKKITLTSFLITKNLEKIFFLERDGFTLPEVVVSTDKVPATQVSHEAMSKEELTEVPGTQEDVLKALQALPGVITAGSLSGQLLVRGSGPSDNQYYVDNIPIGFPYHFGIVSTVDSNFVKDIDFYSSNFGPQFPNSMGGLVDLTQNDGRTDRLGFRADVNIFFGEFEVETPVTSDSSLFMAFRESYLNLLIGNFTGNDGSSFEIPEFGDYQVKYSWNPSPKVHWDFQALGSADSDSATFSASATVAQQDPDLAGAFNFTDGYNSQGVNFKDTSDDQNTITNTLYHTNNYFNFLIGGQYYEDNIIEDFGDKASLKHEFDSDTSLEGGIQYDHFINSLNAYFVAIPTTPNQQNNFEFTTAQKINAQDMTNSDDFSAYLDQKFKALDKKLEVSIGARLDYVNSDFTLFLTPKVSAAYHLTADTTLKAAYGYYDEAPDRIFGYPLLDAQLGNPHLGPEQSIASVLGFEQKLDESGLLFRVEGYEKDLSNLIVSNSNGTPGFEYLNTGTGYARGIEFFLRQPPTDRFFGWISYALSDSERIDTPGGTMYSYDYDEPNVLNAVGNYKINPGWDAGLKVLYATGHPYTPAILNSASVSMTQVNGQPVTFYTPQYAATNSVRLPDYFRLDFSTSIKTVYDTWEWKIYLDISNLTGAKNVLGYNNNNTYTQSSPIYDLPFLPYLGIEVKY
jgi:hypothetical protein